MTNEERRRSPRIDRRFMVKYRCPSRGQAQWMMSPIKNISSSGVRFIGETGYPTGVVLELLLHLPTSTEAVPVNGVVVWQRGGAMQLTEHGVQFVSASAAAKQQIQQALEFLLKKRES